MGRSKKSKYQARSFESINGHESYIRLYESLVYSDAFKSLSHASRTVYTLIRLQYKGDYTGSTVICPYSVFNEYGMNNSTVKKSIQELEAKGFITTKRGTRQCTSENLHRTPNEYTLISKWQDYVIDESDKRIIGKKKTDDIK